MIKNDPLVLI